MKGKPSSQHKFGKVGTDHRGVRITAPEGLGRMKTGECLEEVT